MREFRVIENATAESGTNMQIVRGLSLLRALEKKGYKIPNHFSGDLFETLLDDAISQGVTVPYKRFDKYTKIEERNLLRQLEGKKFNFGNLVLQTEEDELTEMKKYLTPSQLELYKENQMYRAGFTKNYHGQWVRL